MATSMRRKIPQIHRLRPNRRPAARSSTGTLLASQPRASPSICQLSRRAQPEQEERDHHLQAVAEEVLGVAATDGRSDDPQQARQAEDETGQELRALPGDPGERHGKLVQRQVAEPVVERSARGDGESLHRIQA